jgi:alkyl hydroperoxide reductase subunit AhpC
MATLCHSAAEGAVAMRDWLDGDWCMVFSHPEDFEDQGLERDRWLDILRQEFQAEGVRALACAGDQQASDASWVSALAEDRRRVRLLNAGDEAERVFDLPALALCETLRGLPARYVLIVDDTLTRRGVLRYTPGRAHCSPLELLASIHVLRGARRPSLAA